MENVIWLCQSMNDNIIHVADLKCSNGVMQKVMLFLALKMKRML